MPSNLILLFQNHKLKTAGIHPEKFSHLKHLKPLLFTGCPVTVLAWTTVGDIETECFTETMLILLTS